MKLLLHCCCAPCTITCNENLTEDGIEPTLFWYNPNIQPYPEYQNRRDTLTAYAAAENLSLIIEDEYGTDGLSETTDEKRCETCYRLRLEKTAAYAAENGFETFSTSLLTSPYQRHDLIRQIGEETAAKYGVVFFYRDFRPLFRQG